MSVDIVPLQHIQILTHTAIEGVTGARHARDPLSWYSLPYNHLDGLEWSVLAEFERRATLERAGVIGQMLLDENVVSYGHAYPETPLDHYPLWSRVPYRHERFCWRLSPVECLKAVEGFVWHAAEHAGWCDSEASQFCAALQVRAMEALVGWREAPFLFDHILVGARTVRSRSQGLAATAKG